MTRGRRQAVMLILALLTVGCDRVTKHLAVATLRGLPRQSFLGDTLRLEIADNPGAFLSLGAELPPAVRTLLFTIGTGIILAGLAVVGLRRRLPARVALGLAIAWAGGVSNLLDRATRGSVIDFLNVGIGPVRSGIFNVADVAILAGTLIALWRRTTPAVTFGPEGRRD
jgi:signal peptidase II